MLTICSIGVYEFGFTGFTFSKSQEPNSVLVKPRFHFDFTASVPLYHPQIDFVCFTNRLYLPSK